MLMRCIPASGEKIPVLGLGTWPGFNVGPSPLEREDLTEVLATLADSGARVIDTSPMYGTAESVTGDLIASMRLRDEVFLATKVWTRGRRRGLRQMESSFRYLQTDIIDLMQVHNLVDWQRHLPALRSWQGSGRLRYIGYTHYVPSAFPDLMDALISEPVDFVQICYSIDVRDAEAEMLEFCRSNGIATLINRPFGGGSLLARLEARPLPVLARELGCTTWAQFCLKYVISHPDVTCVIPGTQIPATWPNWFQPFRNRFPMLQPVVPWLR